MRGIADIQLGNGRSVNSLGAAEIDPFAVCVGNFNRSGKIIVFIKAVNPALSRKRVNIAVGVAVERGNTAGISATFDFPAEELW